jgi:hypothetical protein
MTIAYTTGQITLTNGSAVVTGIGTGWAISLIVGGIVAAEADGNTLPIETVDSDTQITAAIAWKGATGTYDYALVRDTAYLQQLDMNSSTLARLIAELDAGTIYKYDASGDLAGRATYDERPKGFSYLVIIGVSQPALYVKASATSGDWSGPFAYGTGPTGATGPTGPAGIANPRGTYSGATAYVKNDVVLYNGSSFVALGPTTGNAPPTLPTTSNTYWQLTAIKGTDGTGTGDVVGPAGATDDMPAFFDGTTGKLLKFKTKAAFKTWLAATALDVSFSNTTANLPGSPATVQAAIDALSQGGGKNDAILAMEIADLKGQRQGMNGGIADSFDDETGVDTANAVNRVYDATNDWYSPARTATAQAAGLGSNTASGGEFTLIDRSFTLVNNDSINSIGTYSTTAIAALTVKVARRVSSTVYDILASYTFAHPGGGWFDYVLPTPFVLPSTGTLYSAVVQPASTNLNIYASGTRAYKALDQAVGNGVTGFAEDTGNSIPARVVYTYKPMTLPSVAYAAASVPTTARLALQTVEASGALTPNTDFTLEASRDGGTTWTAATLVLTMSLNNIKMYEGAVSLTGQPSGSSMKWRAKSLTNKNIVMSGVVLQQS